MLFNSFSFLIFLPIVFVSYYALPYKYRNALLFVASSIFYMYFVPKYILILFFIICADYLLAFQIAKRTGRQRAFFLTLSILINLGTLFFFKYFNFFNENIASLAQALHFNYPHTLLTFALPLGLSFHVFQSLSYVIEVYKGKYAPERNLLNYGVYVLFFPQLVAGPIERPAHLLPQLESRHDFDPLLARRGLERMLWGFFKKLVIADQISRIIEVIYPTLPHESLSIFFFAALFAYQLYCDFSGYSDIAIGTAMLFGITLTENFDRPFAAKSITELWRRWHMSLSSWLRDYLYYPLIFWLGPISKFKIYVSTLITFTLIGLWHGASWTFVVFGLLQGIYLVAEGLTDPLRKKVSAMWGKAWHFAWSFFQILLTFFLFAASLVFFRSETVGRGWELFKALFTIPEPSVLIDQFLHNEGYIGMEVMLVPTIVAIIVLEVVQYVQAKKKTFHVLDAYPRALRYGTYYACVLTILFFGYLGGQSFIYFQF